MHIESKKLREQRQVHVDALHALVAAAQKEDRALSDEEREKFNKADEAQQALKDRIDTLERAYKIEREQLESAEQRQERETGTPRGAEDEAELRKQRVAAYAEAWRIWQVRGMVGLNAEQQETLQTGFQAPESRQQGTTPDAAGGYLVPDEAMRAIETATLAVGEMLENITIMRTDTGARLPMPTDNDTANKGEQVDENTPNTEEDLAFGQIVLDSYTYSSKIVKVSMQLLQDSATNLDTYVPARLGERIGRIVNERLTIGTGTDMPNGIVNAPTTPAAAAAEIEYADLLDMEHSVDPSYRRQGAQYMFNDMTLKAIKELQDNENRPLWLPSVRAGDPDRILGRTYVINQDYADIGTGNVSMSFGLLTKYVARQVNQVVMMRLTERYAEFLQVGFLGFQRWDGDILDAGTNPIKGLLHP